MNTPEPHAEMAGLMPTAEMAGLMPTPVIEDDGGVSSAVIAGGAGGVGGVLLILGVACYFAHSAGATLCS